MASLRIGLTHLPGKLVNYAKRYGMVELAADRLPNPATLRRWRREVPAPFGFSLVLPRSCRELAAGAAADAELARAMKSAEALEASCLCLLTPPSVRPTAQHKERIAALGLKLGRSGQLLVWEAGGLWSPEDVEVVAAAGSWLPIADAAEAALPPGPIAYTRIQAFGRGGRLGPGRITRIAGQLAGRREAFVVVDAAVGSLAASRLPDAVASVGAPAAVPQLFRPTPSLGLDQHDEEQ